MSSAGSPASSPPPCSTCPRAAIASSAPARSTPAKRNHGLLFGGRGWGAPSPDHADSHPVISSRKWPRDYSLPLRQRAEDTGLARVPPSPSLTLGRLHFKTKADGGCRRFSSREAGGAGGTSPVDPYLLRAAEARNQDLVARER